MGFLKGGGGWRKLLPGSLESVFSGVFGGFGWPFGGLCHLENKKIGPSPHPGDISSNAHVRLFITIDQLVGPVTRNYVVLN